MIKRWNLGDQLIFSPFVGRGVQDLTTRLRVSSPAKHQTKESP